MKTVAPAQSVTLPAKMRTLEFSDWEMIEAEGQISLPEDVRNEISKAVLTYLWSGPIKFLADQLAV